MSGIDFNWLDPEAQAEVIALERELGWDRDTAMMEYLLTGSALAAVRGMEQVRNKKAAVLTLLPKPKK